MTFKCERRRVLRRAQHKLRDGQVSGRELVDGVPLLYAEALLFSPRFLNDVLGVALLVPPVCTTLRRVRTARLSCRAALRLDKL